MANLKRVYHISTEELSGLWSLVIVYLHVDNFYSILRFIIGSENIYDNLLNNSNSVYGEKTSF